MACRFFFIPLLLLFVHSNSNNQGLQGFKRKDQMDAKSKDDSNINLTLRLIMQGKVIITEQVQLILICIQNASNKYNTTIIIHI